MWNKFLCCKSSSYNQIRSGKTEVVLEERVFNYLEGTFILHVQHGITLKTTNHKNLISEMPLEQLISISVKNYLQSNK